MTTRRRDAGFILINVLVVLGLAATVVYGMLTLADLSIARSQSFSEAGQGLALIRGGEQSAIAALRRDAVAAPDTDSLAEPWAEIAQAPIAIPGGSFALRIEDAQGRFNLNTLAPADPDRPADRPGRGPRHPARRAGRPRLRLRRPRGGRARRRRRNHRRHRSG